MKPLIAVSPYRLKPGRIANWADAGEAVPADYLDGLRRAGALPIVAAGERGDAEALVRRVDGVMLIGGADVDPARYGQEPHPSVYGLDPRRDDFELALAAAAMSAEVPMLAICRGVQVLNVARGGTLLQHLPDLDGTGPHRPENGELQVLHRVLIEPGTRLEKLAGGTASLEDCPSAHHQAIGDVGEGLVVTARSEDGVVEGVETPPDEGWCLGIQWHPERTAREDQAQQALFDGFVAACE